MAFRPGGGKKGVNSVAIDFYSVADVRKSKNFLRLKLHSFTAFKPGEGPRALRFALWPFPWTPSHSTHKTPFSRANA